MEYVIHLAALSSVPASVDDPEAAHHINASGTLNLLTASKEAGVRRLVYASTSAVYGNNPMQPKDETMAPELESPYAASKLAGEYYCRVFSGVYGLETVSLRYFNIYGKRQDPQSQYAAVIPKFIISVLKGESPTIHGDGNQSRDFISVDDCNQANIKACFAPDCSGMFFNIGSGKSISVNDLFVKIRRLIGNDIEAIYGEPRTGDVKESLADISRARKFLSYSPDVEMDSGLADTIGWYRKTLGET